MSNVRKTNWSLQVWRHAWCGLLLLTVASHGAALPQVLSGEAQIQFAGTSTLHDFSGQLPAQPFSLLLSNGTWSASADVLAGQMTTANPKRDRNMHRMFATNDFPKIHGTVVAAPIPGGSTTNLNITLTLKIRNTSKDLPATISGWTETADAVKFHAEWELSLKNYDLKPPSVIGVIRVGDRVQLQADVTAHKKVAGAVSSIPTP